MAEPPLPTSLDATSPYEYSATMHDPPATPSEEGLLMDWVRIGLNPSRQRMAAVAQTQSTQGLRQSFIAIGIIAALTSIATSIIYFTTSTRVPVGQNATYQPYTFNQAAINLLEQLISYMVIPVFVALALALFMPKHWGAFVDRFRRALWPAALVTVPIQAVNFVATIITTLLTVHATPALITLTTLTGKTDPASVKLQDQLSQTLSGPFTLIALVTGLFTAYAVVQYIQSGAVTSQLHRFGIFGIMVLAFIVYEVALAVVLYPLNFIYAH